MNAAPDRAERTYSASEAAALPDSCDTHELLALTIKKVIEELQKCQRQWFDTIQRDGEESKFLSAWAAAEHATILAEMRGMLRALREYGPWI